MGPKQGIFGRKWLLWPKILVSAENNPFGRFTIRGTYCWKPFGRNSAENYGRYNGRKLFRSHTSQPWNVFCGFPNLGRKEQFNRRSSNKSSLDFLPLIEKQNESGGCSSYLYLWWQLGEVWWITNSIVCNWKFMLHWDYDSVLWGYNNTPVITHLFTRPLVTNSKTAQFKVLPCARPL